MRFPFRSALVLFMFPLFAGCAGPALMSPAASPGSPPPPAPPPAAPGEGGTLRIIAFGAHPDDCEIKAGGAGALWASQGHQVKFVSLTNGDIGHWQSAGGPLARRRFEEVEKAAKMLGVTTQVVDIHDGELMPTLENRRKVTRLIREWKADLVLAPRPNDYHPDHRYTGILVQDAAYMVTVPFFCPDVPHLEKNPTFLYYSDGFQRPNPFRPDVVVDIDPVLKKKLDALGIMKSQFFEGGANGNQGLLAGDEAGRASRDREVSEGFARRFRQTAENYRSKLADLYGEERAKKVTAAEAFEVCEYGNQPSKEELKKLFPFFSGN
jgi:LmbE family N-acetylglucosaminyl deacetylase